MIPFLPPPEDNDFTPLITGKMAHATYLPAVNAPYVRAMSKSMAKFRGNREKSLPGYARTSIFNFLDKSKGKVRYPYALYSAGQAMLDTAKGDVEEAFIQKRNRRTTKILADSGGFQLITGVLDIKWDNEADANKTRRDILNWIEHTADGGMTLDVPLAAIDVQPNKWTFEKCLAETIKSNRIFAEKKTDTAILNVLHGRTIPEEEAWYKAVKDFPFQGWAFGGGIRGNLGRVLRCLIKLRDDKMLDKGRCQWMHFLGVEQAHTSLAYTAIQRILRFTVNDEIMISFDSSNPFREADRWQQFVTHITFQPKKPFINVNTVMARKEDAAYFDNPYAPRSPILEGLTAKDLFPDGVTADSGMDELSYQILMLNNLYMRLLANYQVNHVADAIRGSQALAREKGITPDPSFLQGAVEIEDIIIAIFRSETPLSLIDEHRAALEGYF